VLLGGLLLGGGGALVSQVHELWQLYLYWGVVAAFGAAALYVIPTMVLSRFFLRKRGRAVGWASVGVSVGQAILVPLVGVAIQRYGWRAAIMGLGSVVVAVTSVVGYMFLREDPESMGLYVDGVEPDAPLEPLEPVIVEPEEYQEPRVVLTSLTFRLIVLSYFFAVGGIISILTFVVPHMIRMGLTPLQASGAFGVIGAMSAAGSFLFGFASDRLGRKTTILVTTIGIAASFFAASVLPSDLTLLYAWAVLYGLTYGGCPEQYAALISDYYGNRNATTLFGFLTLGGGIGGGLFPLIGGWLVDLTGGYFWTLILLGCSMCAAALMIIAAPPPRS
jgi:MFS family permease